MSPQGDERAFPVYTFFVHDCDFFFPGSLVSRAIKLQGSLPATHLMTSGRDSVNKKEMKFLFFNIYIFFITLSPSFVWTLWNARGAATAKIYIWLALFHISISRFLLNFPASHLLFPWAVSTAENTTFSHLDAKRGALNVDCTYRRHGIGGTSLAACVTAGRESVNSSAPL